MISDKGRRKIVLLLLLVFTFIFFLEPACFGETKTKKGKISAEKKAELERQRKEKLIKEKRAALNNTEWRVVVTSLTQKKGKSRQHQDILRFVNNQIVSEDFLAKGYSATNYSLRIKHDGTVIWETMQTKMQTKKEKKEITFWRGEWRDERMKGIISRQYKVGETRQHDDYSFVSISYREIEEEKEKVEEKVETDTALQIKKPEKR